MAGSAPRSPSLGVIRSTREYLQNTPGVGEDSPSPEADSGHDDTTSTVRDTPRQIRNKLEKQRRDKLNQSISVLASIVPTVVTANRRLDKTAVLRLSASFLRSHNHVFGDSIGQVEPTFRADTTNWLFEVLKGFLITVTYKGLFVSVSPNVKKYLGYSEIDLLGNSIFNYVHEGDRSMLRDKLMPRTPGLLGTNGELIIPDEPGAEERIMEILGKDEKKFLVRFKKLTARSEPARYLSCLVDGSLRKADHACKAAARNYVVRRARARGENPCSSGNDIVFIGMARPAVDTFRNESFMESSCMEYRTRHSVDGEILQAEQKIALIIGYIPNEVYGLNAMNFMHRRDVRWVILALREMYDTHRMIGESCYRLLAKNGVFVYLKTLGCLEVDPKKGSITTFVCTNTVVDEVEGKYLIKEMKKKYSFMVNKNVEALADIESEIEKPDEIAQVEDPKKIEQVILHLVTDLPVPEPGPEIEGDISTEDESMICRYSIIPPSRERIIRSIDKIYNVIPAICRSGAPNSSRVPETNDETNDETNGEPTRENNLDQHPDDHTNGLNNNPSPDTFERVLERIPSANGDIVYDLPTIPEVSNRNLSASQLEDEAGTSYNPVLATKRSIGDMDGNVLLKKKVIDQNIEQVNYPDHDLNQGERELNYLDSLLPDTSLFEFDNALNHLQNMENLEPLTDLRYDEEFQRLMNNCDDDSSLVDGSKHETCHEPAPE